MNVFIPIADVTLTDGQTYDGQLPLWAARPLMVKVTTGTNDPVNIIVREGGSIRKEISLPYQQYGTDIDLSFATPLIRRADRNKSDGTPWFPQQLIEFWSTDIKTRIIIPVFHCDETYWDTLGVDSALPQPPKPRIPNQTLDIYFPYSIHPSDAFQVEVEPVTGAPSNAIFPNTYVLGNTIDITYVKKLTIKNVWGSGLDQVINYEDKLHTDVIYDESLQCALRARWNMRNGQWFWDAFKDYFWSNKFTLIRGRGGVTEQAELTINLEYGEEWYNVYQELLVSSNVVFDLNLPGINQYQNKRFRAEVIGDTGARWSNRTRTYRQQVRFRTTELTDNYVPPLAPDQPSTSDIRFSAQFNPWNSSPSLCLDAWNNIYSNAMWYVESEPSWYAVANGTTLLTPDMFEQGTIDYVEGSTWDEGKIPDNRLIRLKRTFETLDEVYSIIIGVNGYEMQFFYLDENDRMTGRGGRDPIIGRVNTSVAAKRMGIQLNKTGFTPITPAEVSAMNVRWGKRHYAFPAGTSYMYGYMLANTGEPRAGTLSLRSMAGAATYAIPIAQAGAAGHIAAAPSTIAAGYVHLPVTVAITSAGDWSASASDTWITPSADEGGTGTTNVTLTISNNTTNGPRTGTITFRNYLTGQTAVVTVNQGGKPLNITIEPTKVTAPKTSGTVKQLACGSINGWVMIEKPSWVAVAPNNDAAGIVPVSITYTANSTGTKRSGYLKLQEAVTGEIAICIIEQEG